MRWSPSMTPYPLTLSDIVRCLYDLASIPLVIKNRIGVNLYISRVAVLVVMNMLYRGRFSSRPNYSLKGMDLLPKNTVHNDCG